MRATQEREDAVLQRMLERAGPFTLEDVITPGETTVVRAVARRLVDAGDLRRTRRPSGVVFYEWVNA